MSTLETLVTRASKRTGAFDWSALIAAIMAMIQQFLDGCATTEEQWVGIVTNPGPFRRAILLTRIRQAVRQDGKTPVRERGAMAYAIADDLSAVACECEDQVGTVYREAKGE